MLVYSPPDDQPDNMWTKDVLIGIREFEKDIQARDDFKQTCLVTYSADVLIGCDPAGFLSPLDFFPNPDNLE